MTTARAPMSAPRRDGYSFRRYVGRSGLAEIAREWTDLATTLPRRWFHHLPEWYDCYLEALEPDESSISFYAIDRGSTLQAIVPLKGGRMRVLGIPVRTLALPYHDHLPFADIIARPDADVAAVGRALTDQLQAASGPRWDLLVLPRVLADAAAGRLSEGAAALRVACHAHGGCDFIACSEASSTRDLVSGKMLRDLRRRGTKLKERGEVEYSVACTGAAIARAFDDFLTVEASGWKGVHGSGTAIALDPALVRFYRAMLDRFAPLDACEISQLRVGGRCVAAQLALVIDGAWYLLKMGYDESLSAMAPGNLLVEKALERICASPHVTEANLVSDAAWHQSWGPSSSRVTTHFVANATLRGIGLVALLRVKERALERRAERERLKREQTETPATSSPGNTPRARRQVAGLT